MVFCLLQTDETGHLQIQTWMMLVAEFDTLTAADVWMFLQDLKVTFCDIFKSTQRKSHAYYLSMLSLGCMICVFVRWLIFFLL